MGTPDDPSSPGSSTLEYDFSFELDTDAPQLKHPTSASAAAAALDRNIVANVIGDSGYKVTVKHISYGTFGTTPVCLLSLTVAFKWRDTRRDRVKSATVELSLHRVDAATGATLEDLPGPHILLFAPELIYGDPRDETRTRERALGGGLAGGLPTGGATASVEASRTATVTQAGERRMRIQGQKYGPVDPEVEDTAEWTLEENAVLKTGILDRFTCAVVLDWSGVDNGAGTGPGCGVHLLCTVKPQLGSSLLPRVLRLRPKRVLPIGLDGHTARGVEFAKGKDLADPTVPWAELLGSYREYENSLLGTQ